MVAMGFLLIKASHSGDYELSAECYSNGLAMTTQNFTFHCKMTAESTGQYPVVIYGSRNNRKSKDDSKTTVE